MFYNIIFVIITTQGVNMILIDEKHKFTDFTHLREQSFGFSTFKSCCRTMRMQIGCKFFVAQPRLHSRRVVH